MDVFEPFLAEMEDPNQRFRLEELLAWVMETFPELEPKIAWNQPMFTDHGTFIIGFSVAKKHLAVAPEKAGIDHFSEAIKKAGYDHTKQLVRISWNQPVDYDLLAQMIVFNKEEKKDCMTFWRG